MARALFLVAAAASAAAAAAAGQEPSSPASLPSSPASSTSSSSPLTVDRLTSLAQAGVAQLLSYYNPSQQWFGNTSSGLPFWETANAVETLSNYMLLTGDLTPLPVLLEVFDASLSPNRYCPGADWCFFDDLGWYVHAWVRLFEATGNQTLLLEAETIFSTLLVGKGWNATCGAMRWAENSAYINAIPNELFLSAAMKLERVTGSSVPVGGRTYSEWAAADWQWWANGPLFIPVLGGLLVTDGLATGSCDGAINPTGSFWTYNQGVILSGLAQLAVATNNASYASLGRTLAETAMAYFSADNGTAGTSPVMIEKNCGPDGVCGGPDGRQFKGVFVRHLVYALPALASFAPDPAAVEEAYGAWILAQAASIEANASLVLPTGTQFSNLWQGPFMWDNTPWVSQGSALDAVLGALSVLKARGS